MGFIGRESTSTEISVCKRIFGLEVDKTNSDMLKRMLGEGVLWFILNSLFNILIVYAIFGRLRIIKISYNRKIYNI